MWSRSTDVRPRAHSILRSLEREIGGVAAMLALAYFKRFIAMPRLRATLRCPGMHNAATSNSAACGSGFGLSSLQRRAVFDACEGAVRTLSLEP